MGTPEAETIKKPQVSEKGGTDGDEFVSSFIAVFYLKCYELLLSG